MSEPLRAAPAAAVGLRTGLHPFLLLCVLRRERDVALRRSGGAGNYWLPIGDSDSDRAARRVLDVSWRGTLAADAAGEWVLPLREAVRHDAAIALGSLAGTLVDRHPRETLDLLEKAIEADPYNEQIYQDILRLHVRMGETGAIDATLELLTRRLAETREHPSRETRELAQRLKH